MTKGAGRRDGRGRPVGLLVSLFLVAFGVACAPRVTPPDPWKGRATPVETATPVAVFTVASPAPTAAPAPDPCTEPPEGPAPVGKIHTIRFLDVGQGDAALITTASGKTVLIDAGDRDERARVLAELRSAGVSKIDLLMASHPHMDHIGGMRVLLDAMPVRLYVDPGTEHGTDTYRDLLLAIQARKIPYQVLRAGKTIKIGDEATLSVFSPGDTLLNSARSKENANSLVVRLSIGTFDVLFTGDAEPETLTALLSSRVLADSSIELLKVAHHGSRYGTSRELIQELRPKVAVISVGHKNEYHHPHPETLQILAEDCVRTYRTDRDGTVLVRTDGTGFRVIPQRTTPPPPGNAAIDPSAAPTAGPVFATKSGKTWHIESCFHIAGKDALLEFSSVEEAEAAGLRRASGCRAGALGALKDGVASSKPAAAWKGPVVASSRGKVFHPVGCPHIDKIKPENRVEYGSPEEAEGSGLRAGSGCRPGATGP